VLFNHRKTHPAQTGPQHRSGALADSEWQTPPPPKGNHSTSANPARLANSASLQQTKGEHIYAEIVPI